MTRTQSPISCKSALLLVTAGIAALVAAAALPIDGGLTLEGMSNKLRSGSIAIANNRQPSDARWERVVKQNGGTVHRDNMLLPTTSTDGEGAAVPGEEQQRPQGQARKTTHGAISDVEEGA